MPRANRINGEAQEFNVQGRTVMRSKRSSRSSASLRSSQRTSEVRVSGIFNFAEASQFQQAHREWVTEALRRELAERDDRRSEAVAVGSPPQFLLLTFYFFRGRDVHPTRIRLSLHEVFAGKNDVLRLDNSRFYEEKSEI
jgi:hypothetical protein